MELHTYISSFPWSALVPHSALWGWHYTSCNKLWSVFSHKCCRESSAGREIKVSTGGMLQVETNLEVTGPRWDSAGGAIWVEV